MLDNRLLKAFAENLLFRVERLYFDFSRDIGGNNARSILDLLIMALALAKPMEGSDLAHLRELEITELLRTKE